MTFPGRVDLDTLTHSGLIPLLGIVKNILQTRRLVGGQWEQLLSAGARCRARAPAAALLAVLWAQLRRRGAPSIHPVWRGFAFLCWVSAQKLVSNTICRFSHLESGFL